MFLSKHPFYNLYDHVLQQSWELREYLEVKKFVEISNNISLGIINKEKNQMKYIFFVKDTDALFEICKVYDFRKKRCDYELDFSYTTEPTFRIKQYLIKKEALFTIKFNTVLHDCLRTLDTYMRYRKEQDLFINEIRF